MNPLLLLGHDLNVLGIVPSCELILHVAHNLTGLALLLHELLGHHAVLILVFLRLLLLLVIVAVALGAFVARA